MQSKKRTAALVGVGGLAAAGVAGIALLGGPAQAEPAPSASGSAPAAPAAPQADPSASAPAAPGGEARGRPDPAARQQELAAALAKELGIDQAKVAAALEKVRTDQQNAAKADRTAELKTRLDAAVKDGKLTAAQRDAILKAAEAGVLPGGGPGGGGFGGRGHGPR